jgi:hypothetical protein
LWISVPKAYVLTHIVTLILLLTLQVWTSLRIVVGCFGIFQTLKGYPYMGVFAAVCEQEPVHCDQSRRLFNILLSHWKKVFIFQIDFCRTWQTYRLDWTMSQDWAVLAVLVCLFNLIF